MRCWDFGGDGALGYGSTESIGDNETPASVGNVPLSGRALSLSLGAHHSCARLEQGQPETGSARNDGPSQNRHTEPMLEHEADDA